MKIVIASDIHANQAALSVLPQDFDELWVLGDLVNYGPQPAEVVDFVRSRSKYVVCGNHDHSIGYGDDPRCTARFRNMADATRKFTDSILGGNEKKYLRGLPLQIELQVGKTRFRLCHAIPSDPLYGYCPPESERWVEECRLLPVDVLLVGHTHIQFVKKFGNCLVVNPGSLGQPKTRNPLACFAVWEDGSVTLRATVYPMDNTIEKIKEMPIPVGIQQDLITVLRTGLVPEERSEITHVENRRN
jgi:putative phosphoesterase